jgi:hypothetical protein
MAEIFENSLVFNEQIQQKDGFYITVWLASTSAATAANYPIFFIAHHACEVISISEVHGTLGTDAGTVKLQVEKLTGTTAKGSGLEVLKDATPFSAFNLKATINTVQTKSGTSLQNKTLNPGDRLALKSEGTLTAVADVCVTLYLKPSGRGDYRS